jgi:hypothetical protein
VKILKVWVLAEFKNGVVKRAEVPLAEFIKAVQEHHPLFNNCDHLLNDAIVRRCLVCKHEFATRDTKQIYCQKHRVDGLAPKDADFLGSVGPKWA